MRCEVGALRWCVVGGINHDEKERDMVKYLLNVVVSPLFMLTFCM